jgi:16S rRNA (cytosine1402-N4)-methyltransferase
VKHAFKSGLRDGTYDAIADDVLRPSPSECRANPRAKAAKLPWACRHSQE